MRSERIPFSTFMDEQRLPSNDPNEDSRPKVSAPIEGGAVVYDASSLQIKGPFDVERHRGNLTTWLILLLAGVVVGHYVCVLVLGWNDKKIDGVNNAFNASLPVISGLVGSAVAYYFTKSNQGREK
jgi:hypothetical protein